MVKAVVINTIMVGRAWELRVLTSKVEGSVNFFSSPPVSFFDLKQ